MRLMTMGCGNSQALNTALRDCRANVEHTRKALRRLLIDIQQGYVSTMAVIALNRGLLRSTEHSIAKILRKQELSSSDRDKVQYYGELIATFSEVLCNVIDPTGELASREHYEHDFGVGAFNAAATSSASASEAESDAEDTTTGSSNKPSAKAHFKLNSVAHGVSLPAAASVPTVTSINPSSASPADRIAVKITDGLTFYVQSTMDNLKAFSNFLNEQLAPLDVPRLLIHNLRTFLCLLITLLALIAVFMPEYDVQQLDEDDARWRHDEDEGEEPPDHDFIIQLVIVIVACVLLAVDSIDRHWLQRKRVKMVSGNVQSA